MVGHRIGIIGLGYVGLPLALAFAEKYCVVGFDISSKRINSLRHGIDQTGNASGAEIQLLHDQFIAGKGNGLYLTDDASDLKGCNFFIITVPTPLTLAKQPDLSFLIAASETVGRFLKKDDVVIYESTVYPGCTEEDCIPVLEQVSGLKFNTDFFCGYSPERINPGDKIHTLKTVVKVTSGSTPEVAEKIDELYSSIITAGTYKAPSIKVAEAAKAIENAQRDVNISFMNELALIFDRMGIDTGEVLDAASTKWNFLPFRPGLVGGHCIGVDPHYLAFKSMKLGYQPQVILSGREVNEKMGVFVAEKMIALLSAAHNGDVNNCKVLILGFAFKENCADTRNTKVIDIVRKLEGSGIATCIYDPHVDVQGASMEFGVTFVPHLPEAPEGVIVAVAHEEFKRIDYHAMKKRGTIFFDTKGLLPKEFSQGRL